VGEWKNIEEIDWEREEAGSISRAATFQSKNFFPGLQLFSAENFLGPNADKEIFRLSARVTSPSLRSIGGS
jgi:hypothetical protein